MSSRLKVALINYRDDAAIGGSLRVMENIARHLDPAETDIQLVFAYGGPGPVGRASAGLAIFYNRGDRAI